MNPQPILHYFAYGSNMNPARVAQRGLGVVDARAGRLHGYVLSFNKMSRQHPGLGHANIEYSPTGTTEGVMYELLDGAEILKMDPFEHAPWNYGRDVVQIKHAQGTSWAWTYFANPAVVGCGLNPPPAYLQHLLAGRAYLSEEYYTSLLAWRR